MGRNISNDNNKNTDSKDKKTKRIKEEIEVTGLINEKTTVKQKESYTKTTLN